MDINTINNLQLVRQRGFSLIELMIAVPFGLLVMLAVLQVFTANIQSVNLQNAYSRVQENGRVATELMIRDIRTADYWGCIRDTSLIVNHLDTTDPDYDAALMSSGGSGVAGEDNVSSKTIASINVKDDTDTLTLRGAGSFSGVKVVPPYMTPNAAAIHINTGVNIAKGQIILISDCTGADLFSNTAGNTFNSGSIIHNTGALPVAGAVANAIKPMSHTYETSAQIMIPHVKTYFIGQNSGSSFSLFRSDNGVASELVRGVNDLQLVYGEDTNGNGSADSFSNAASVTDMDTVRSVRLSLVADSGDSSSGTTLERTYSITANIRNRTLQ
ncbi:PilW family protein [Psychromonas aquimarina]|uniref:PilW family protein n=1 Tax=Psychromonas aquimarina TaxID=444919 RepID=UPI0004298A9A|nr:PilW family protein [Psychromonas aquimarina]